jgi:hypothetical protein
MLTSCVNHGAVIDDPRIPGSQELLPRTYLMPNHPNFQLPMCSYCADPVEIENARTDEDGKAIHAECYLLRLKAQRSTLPSAD